MATEEFEEVSRESDNYEEDRDCAVKAVAIATGIDYNVVHAIFSKFGRGSGRPTMTCVIDDVLEFFKFLQIEDESFHAKTIKTLERCSKDGTYLIYVPGHVLCMKGRKIHDWTSGRQYRIKRIVRLIDCNKES